MTDERAAVADERAVSIAVTHVLTIGITTILISGLLIGAAGMLETQRERAGQNELRSIGERTASEIVTAVDRGNRTDSNVTVRSRQPSHSVGGSYEVTLASRSDCYVRTGYDACLELGSSNDDLGVEVPISLPADVAVQESSVQGGDVVVAYSADDASVTLTGGGS